MLEEFFATEIQKLRAQKNALEERLERNPPTDIMHRQSIEIAIERVGNVIDIYTEEIEKENYGA